MTTPTRPSVERLREGRARVAAAGGRLGGAAPYGWAPVPSATLVKVPGEQAVIWLICHLADKGRSYRAIAQQLNDLDIPGPSGGPWNHATARVARLRVQDGIEPAGAATG